MDKKLARRIALEIAISAISSNTNNGSDLIPNTLSYGGYPETDMPQVVAELEKILDRLEAQYKQTED